MRLTTVARSAPLAQPALDSDGQRIHLFAQAYLEAITAATDDLRQGVGNSLYVHSAPSVASLWLMPRLRDFAQSNPDISVNLSAAHTPSDFALGQADVDIRYGVPQWPNLEVVPRFKERVIPLASPAFIRTSRLKRVEQLLDVPLIQSNVSVVQWSDWFARFADRQAPDRFAVRFDRAQMSLEAAMQDLGVALESATIAGRYLMERNLKPVFGLDRAIYVEAHFLVYPARHAKRKPVAKFLDWVRRQASATTS